MVQKNPFDFSSSETLNPNESDRRRIQFGNVIGTLTTRLPIDSVGIRCLVPVWNSSNVEKLERRFTVKSNVIIGIIACRSAM